jgi:hypothetical protein
MTVAAIQAITISTILGDAAEEKLTGGERFRAISNGLGRHNDQHNKRHCSGVLETENRQAAFGLLAELKADSQEIDG